MLRIPEFFLLERDSRSDLVGDLESDLLVGDGGNESVEALSALELLVDFFLGEDLRKPGRTIEKMMAAAPGYSSTDPTRACESGYPCIETAIPALSYFLSYTLLVFGSSRRSSLTALQYLVSLAMLKIYFPSLGSGDV